MSQTSQSIQPIYTNSSILKIEIKTKVDLYMHVKQWPTPPSNVIVSDYQHLHTITTHQPGNH